MTVALSNVPVLETERLRMRAPVATDYEPFVAFRLSDRSKWVGGPYTRTQAFDQFGELCGQWIIHGFGRWIVADKTTDEPLGVVGLMQPEDWPEPEIAWAVFEAGEGKGIAYEAAMASRDYAYKTLGWTRVISLIVEGNDRSVALARRMGAVFEKPFIHESLGRMDVWLHAAPGDLP